MLQPIEKMNTMIKILPLLDGGYQSLLFDDDFFAPMQAGYLCATKKKPAAVIP